MSEYAIIGKVKLEPIPGAKTLQLARYQGLTFAVGLDVNENDLYVIFMPDGKLGELYATLNDCIYRGKDEQGNRLGGYFDANRKVRSLKLMGGMVISVGYIASLDTLRPFGDVSKLKEGDVVDTWNGYVIAEKYLVNSVAEGGKKKPRREIRAFAKHPDTKQFYKHMADIEPGSLITITEKLHGTSARYAYIKNEHLRWWERPVNWVKGLLGLPVDLYRLYAGTRNTVILKEEGGYYGSNELWLQFAAQLELLQDETIYGEIVGWFNGKPIQKTGGVEFTYGIPKGKAEFYVYNITHKGVPLSWEAIKQRCAELNLEYVPELNWNDANLPANIHNQFANVYPGPSFEYDGDLDALKNFVYSLTDGNSIWGKHIREGVVLRVEKNGKVQFIKNKSNAFYVLEDASKNAGESNLEEDN